MGRTTVHHAVPVAAATAVVAFDQASKALVVDRLGPEAPRHEMAILGDAVTLRYVENTGAAFGLLQGQAGLLTLAALAILGGLVFYYLRAGAASPATAAAIALIAGGAVGNLIDRLRLGYVVDFVAVGSWPTFNLADTAITVGVVLLAVDALIGAPSRQTERSAPTSAGTGQRPSLPTDG